jgi:hypothetical protein
MEVEEWEKNGIIEAHSRLFTKIFLEQSLFEALLAGRALPLNLQFDIDTPMETIGKTAPDRPRSKLIYAI